MSSPSGSQPQRITLENLAALNREVSALVRSGLPLEVGLQQVADEFGGGTSRLAARLAEETSAGKSLAEAVAAQGDSLPPVYRAVVEAGLKSGRLAAALEGFAETAARMASLRQIAGQAAIYPVIVMIVAWLMLVLVVTMVLPSYDVLDLPNRTWITRLRVAPLAAWVLAMAVPLVILVLAASWWRASGIPTSAQHGRRWLQWIPGASRTATLGAQANFADLLHMLVSSRVPMTEALPLAAHASGAAALEQPAQELSTQLAAGHALNDQAALLRPFPPLVRTVLLSDANEEGLLAGLKRAAEVYRERAAGWLGDMAVLLPIGVTLGLAVGVVGVYALAILQPYFSMLKELTHWGWN
ncbi:MAG: type II secretion system F family protein [Pirellulales bacterium]|nr:type II secretion system F family protein [Pirellulales bacterium]